MLKKVANTFFSKGLAAFVNLAIAVVLSNYLGPEGKGTQSILLTTIVFVITVTGLFGPSPLSFVLSRKHSFTALWTSHIWSVLVVTVYMVFSLFLFPGQSMFWHVGTLALLSSISSSNLSVLLVVQKTNRYNYLQLIVPVVTILVLIAEFNIYENTTIQAYVKSLYIAYAILLMVSFFDLLKPLRNSFVPVKKMFFADTRELFKYGFFNQSATIIQLISFRGAYYILNWIEGSGAVGVYSNAVSIAESVWLISRSMALVFYSQLLNNVHKEEQLVLFQKNYATSFYLQIMAVVVLFALPSSLYVTIFGEGFMDLKQTMVFLLPGIVIYGQTLITSHFNSANGRHYINTISNFVGMVVTITLTFLLVKAYSAKGAALALTVGYLSLLFVQLMLIKKTTNAHIGLKLYHINLPQIANKVLKNKL